MDTLLFFSVGNLTRGRIRLDSLLLALLLFLHLTLTTYPDSNFCLFPRVFKDSHVGNFISQYEND